MSSVVESILNLNRKIDFALAENNADDLHHITDSLRVLQKSYHIRVPRTLFENIKKSERREPFANFLVIAGHGDANPNSSWLNGKGFWLSYGLAVLLLHLMLLCLPFISTAVSWTLTNLIHNLFMLIFLHIVKGAPFEPLDQGKTRSLTHWEQIDYGKRFTVTRKFLTVVPVILFVLTSFYTKYDTSHFIVNIIALVAVLLPKLPHFHRFWLFDSNDHSY